MVISAFGGWGRRTAEFFRRPRGWFGAAAADPLRWAVCHLPHSPGSVRSLVLCQFHPRQPGRFLCVPLVAGGRCGARRPGVPRGGFRGDARGVVLRATLRRMYAETGNGAGRNLANVCRLGKLHPNKTCRTTALRGNVKRELPHRGLLERSTAAYVIPGPAPDRHTVGGPSREIRCLHFRKEKVL